MPVVSRGNTVPRAHHPRGIGADPDMCEQVRAWHLPRDLHEIQMFVSLCSYYSRQIPWFTELAAPLYELAIKGTDFKWTNQWHRTFDSSKTTRIHAPILGFP